MSDYNLINLITTEFTEFLVFGSWWQLREFSKNLLM